MDSKATNQKQLEDLRRRVLSNQPNQDTAQVRTLIAVMREVGGYEQLMNMPLSAVREVIDFLKWERREQEKANRRSS